MMIYNLPSRIKYIIYNFSLFFFLTKQKQRLSLKLATHILEINAWKCPQVVSGKLNLPELRREDETIRQMLQDMIGFKRTVAPQSAGLATGKFHGNVFKSLLWKWEPRRKGIPLYLAKITDSNF